MSEIQRARILAAMIDVASERGLADATVSYVVSRSGVSRRTFYEIFPDREACFLAALDTTVERASEYVLPAYRTPGSWQQSVRNALTGLLSFLDAQPAMGRLLIVESLAGGPVALKRRRELFDVLTTAIDLGRDQPNARKGIPPLTSEAVLGAVLSLIHSRMVYHDPRPLIELTGALMSIVVLPYLGPTTAQRELQQPTPQPQQSTLPTTRENNALSELPMRLTYRTILVLTAIANTPGASNRQIGRAAGIQDQGQTSKLLKRLTKLGLIQNTGEGQTRGAPNAWTLTPTGTHTQHAIHQQTTRATGAH